MDITYADGELRLELIDSGPGITVGQGWSIVDKDTEQALETRPEGTVQQYPLPGRGVSWSARSSRPEVLFEYRAELGSEATLAVRVTNFSATPVTLRWTQMMSLLPVGATLFGPCGGEFFSSDETPVRLGYRQMAFESLGSLSIPMATVFDDHTDVGITAAGHIEMPVPPFGFEYDASRGEATLSRTVLRLPPGQSLTVTNYLIPHAGCWRPGLAWVRDRFASFFMVPDEVAARTHGCYASSNVADASLCRRFAAEGVKNLEIHYTYPHLGKYLPEDQPWVQAVDDKWTIVKRTTDPGAPPEDAPYETIKAYMQGVVKPTGTTDRIRQLLADLRKVGIQSFYYFQSTEAWEFFAETCFPDAILRHEDGSPKLTWYDTVQIDCRPETRWGQYIRRQLEGVFDTFPEADGIFMDQSAIDEDDYRVCGMTDVLGRIARDRGKLCYWNGPYMVELIEHAAGMLAEDGAVTGGKIKYLAIGNKVCCGRGAGEALYQRNLLNGLWPSAPSMHHYYSFLLADESATDLPIPDDKRELHERYMPLFERYAGKTWVLEPHALTVPEAVQGNIFQRGDGEYLVPLIVPQHSSGDGRYIDDIEIVVRASGVDSIRGVSVVSPDYEGQYAVEWRRKNGEIHVRVDWLNSAAMVVLSPEPVALEPMPAHGPVREADASPGPRIMAAYLSYDGLVPTGAASKLFSGLKTTAPLPKTPVRRITLNGRPVGQLFSRNYRNWRPGYSVPLTPHMGVENAQDRVDLADCLEADNELLIEPDGPDDFFAIGNVSLTVALADGRVIRSGVVAGPWSSCDDPRAVGEIQSPIRIRISFPVERLKD